MWKPTRCTISKLQTWFQFNHASSNQRRRYNVSQTQGDCFAKTLTWELTYEPSKYERAVLTFPRAHSITQAVGDTAVIVSRDQESELMSSVKAPCKKPYWDLVKTSRSRLHHKFRDSRLECRDRDSRFQNLCIFLKLLKNVIITSKFKFFSKFWCFSDLLWLFLTCK